MASLAVEETLPRADEQLLVEKTADLQVSEPNSQEEQPPHRSHDPQFNQKRSDPFQFGSRLLGEQDDVFEFNAWDHVETDDAYKEYAEQQYEMQRQSPVSDFDKNRLNNNPARMWDLFYKNNTANFFKNRKWLQQEFPILSEVTKEDAGKVTILEIGAGAGNTAFPILASNKNLSLRVHACDYSKQAVEVMRAHESYNQDRMQADVWDVTSDELPPGLEEGSVDVAILIFIFSALAPSQWNKAVTNVYRLLKPGGQVCFRDYGRGDLAQVRFKKGRYLDENFYVRGDGTRVYFFEKEELEQIWTGKTQEASEGTRAEFNVDDLGVDRRMLVNRARKLKMYRCWMQGRFTKK
ncbi:methyltransferase [Colletotrichum higginsianum]|uniref:tRNA N(3)-methylcytidine methyltransferase n=1 Tax=Colletotrichum higginsianum (strain IMI 349063) TaxID=759273 RepID=H1V0F7_COLHI|nr:Methyltransferase [Colletotrichum higginsianum IMI 349063]OBR12102.1 Methyltransferase [Colletotrichum higginsianum IMI 349063]GJC93778.1 methyltransferase [Colletotrichum higginsianum]CCF33708.1 methyltransferase [Colletotrichum higginsianum]